MSSALWTHKWWYIQLRHFKNHETTERSANLWSGCTENIVVSNVIQYIADDETINQTISKLINGKYLIFSFLNNLLWTLAWMQPVIVVTRIWCFGHPSCYLSHLQCKGLVEVLKWHFARHLDAEVKDALRQLLASNDPHAWRESYTPNGNALQGHLFARRILRKCTPYLRNHYAYNQIDKAFWC